MHFAEGTWLAALLIVPLLWLAVKAADRRAAVRAARLLGESAPAHREDWNPRVRGWRRFLFLAGIAWLVVALARPQWGASEVTVTQRGRDVVIALDVSNSMLAEDVTPSRLERAKAELVTFLRSQQDSRVGLVLFAGAAFVQCPLTADFGTAEIFLQMAAPDMISAQGTALSSALQVSRELLLSGRSQTAAADFQAILLVTDGEDLEGDWEDEARTCRREGITVIPVGIGEETGGLIPVKDADGGSTGFLKDDEGGLVLSRIDLASLERLASVGGGSTFRVGLDGLAGERLRTVLERLGRRDFEQRQVTRWQDRYQWPLALALVSLALAVLVRSRRPVPPTMRVGALLAVSLVLVASSGAAEIVRPGWAGAVTRGRQAYAAGDYETALQEFEAARARAPEDPRLALAVGEALFRLERYEEADREFDRARQLTDRDALVAESAYNAGTSALAQGDARAAAEHLRESLRLEPGRQDALLNLETAMLRLEQQQQQQDQQQQDQDQQDQQQQEQQQEQQQQEPQEQQQQEQQQQEQQQQEQQEQQQQQEQQEQQQQERQDQQDQQDQQQGQPEDASPEDEPQDEPSREELDREQAMQLLKALDRDEQELKRSVQRRLRGGGGQSGKRW